MRKVFGISKPIDQLCEKAYWKKRGYRHLTCDADLPLGYEKAPFMPSQRLQILKRTLHGIRIVFFKSIHRRYSTKT